MRLPAESYVSSLSNRNLRPFLLWFHRSLSRDPWREIKKRKTAWSIRCIVRFTARSSIYEMEEWKIRTPGRYHGITRSRRDASWLLILFLSLSVSRCWPLIRWSGISSTCRENHLSEHLLNNETRRNQRGNRIVSCSALFILMVQRLMTQFLRVQDKKDIEKEKRMIKKNTEEK